MRISNLGDKLDEILAALAVANPRLAATCPPVAWAEDSGDRWSIGIDWSYGERPNAKLQLETFLKNAPAPAPAIAAKVRDFSFADLRPPTAADEAAKKAKIDSAMAARAVKEAAKREFLAVLETAKEKGIVRFCGSKLSGDGHIIVCGVRVSDSVWSTSEPYRDEERYGARTGMARSDVSYSREEHPLISADELQAIIASEK